MATVKQILDTISERDMNYDIFAEYLDINQNSRGMARCIFHDDRSPSLSYDVKTGLFHCFGCGAEGNMLQFVMKAENVSFEIAIQKLADRVDMFYEGQEKLELDPAYQPLANAAEAFMKAAKDNLMHDIGAQEYLTKKRGMTLEDMEQYELGYIGPNQLQVSPVLKQLGLFTDSGYSLIEDVIIYPARTIISKNNIPRMTITGFSIKPLDKSQHNSYTVDINYPKGKLVGFGVQRSFNSREGIFLTEGAADVVALNQMGKHGAIAGFSAVLSHNRTNDLLSYLLIDKSPVLNFALDADQTGHDMTKRIAYRLADYGNLDLAINDVQLEFDPDDYITSGKSEDLKYKLNNPRPLYYEVADEIDPQIGNDITQLAKLGNLSYGNDRLLQEQHFAKLTNGLTFGEFIKNEQMKNLMEGSTAIESSNNEQPTAQSISQMTQTKSPIGQLGGDNQNGNVLAELKSLAKANNGGVSFGSPLDLHRREIIFLLRYSFVYQDWGFHDKLIKEFDIDEDMDTAVQEMDDDGRITSKFMADKIYKSISRGF